MEIYYAIVLFVFGTIFGSFYNVVGDRVADGKSIIYPPSHCPKCKHRLTPLELVPILSYLFQGGKCKNCKCKIPLFHPLYEIFVGVLFMFSYISFGFTGDLVIAITFVSMLAIIIVSDYYYMIIPDEMTPELDAEMNNISTEESPNKQLTEEEIAALFASL